MSYFELEAKARYKNGVSIGDIAAVLRTDKKRIEQALLGDHVVRFVVYRGTNSLPTFLDCLNRTGTIQQHCCSDESICFDLPPPLDHPDSQKWAEEAAKIFSDRGFNAVIAPRWPDNV